MSNADEARPEEEFHTADETEANLEAWFTHRGGWQPEGASVMDLRAAAFDAGWFAARKFFEQDAPEVAEDEPRVVEGGHVTLQPLNSKQREEVSRLQALDYAMSRHSYVSDTPHEAIVETARAFYDFLVGKEVQS